MKQKLFSSNILLLLKKVAICSLLFSSVSFASGLSNMNVMWRQLNVSASWLGTVGQFSGGFTTNAGSTYGAGDGMMNNSRSVYTDGSGNMYVADYGNGRINKYTASTGAFIGWIGNIATSPTGGAAGCNGAAVGTFTPGWCTGGTATNGTGDGMMSSPHSVYVDGSGDMYVVDSSNNRINKYTASTGAFVGWIGKIATSPTGGAAGCNGAAVGTFTPGWCTGGTATSGNGNGMMNNPASVYIDGSGNMYVADFSNRRINKYTASTGAFVGWIGKIATSPTGGAAGCNGAAVGTFTPGWCTGGTATFGTGNGMMNNPMSVYIDGSGNMYVADSSNRRINKYTASTGAFIGWIGKILTSPTGGAAGCNGAAVGTFTPGWCTGGTATFGTGNGMMNNPYSVYVDGSGNMYVADYGNSRINKYTASTGAFIGWVGKILTSPTGGAAGCNGAAVGTSTPGWCTGGTSTFGSDDGMMNSPTSVYVDGSGNMYVADSGNSRINNYTASTGAFVGSVSTLAVFQTWNTSNTTTQTGQGDGMMDTSTSVYIDGSGNMYVVDYNHRISKYAASTGTFIGWIGKIATSPTGGAAGCNGAAVGTFTPGWCTGGTATYGSDDGMMNSPTFVYTDGSGNMYVADNGNNRINKYTASTGEFVGWIGKIATSPTGGAAGCSGAAVGTFTPGWCTGGTAISGSGDGMMYNPNSIYIDGSGNMYVADLENARINKYTASTGAFIGWIGNILTSPTGGAAGCNGAAVGTFTPGWCTGGTSDYGIDDGMLSGAGFAHIDGSGNMYVADIYNSRINKYTASTGAFIGWIGNIATSPTGGAAGCNGAAVGTFTPGWCTGGTATNGTGDGMMDSPGSVYVDSNGNMYVADYYNDRINKYKASTGTFTGWIGKIETSPTGGAAGCNGAAVGTFTPGWCKGGTADYGTGNGMMEYPSSVYVDSNGNMYVADYGNSRIMKFKLPYK